MSVRSALLLSVATALLATGPAATHSAWLVQEAPDEDQEEDEPAEDEQDADTPADDEEDEAAEDEPDSDTPADDDEDEAAEGEQDSDTPADDGDEVADEQADAKSDDSESESDQADTDLAAAASDDGAGVDQPAAIAPEIIVLWSNPPQDEYELEAVQLDDIRYVERCSNRRYCEETRDIVLADLAELLLDYVASSLRNRREDTPKLVEGSNFSKYRVSTGQKLDLEAGKPGPNDAQIWGQVTRLVPVAQSDRLIGKLQIFSDPKSNTIAFMDRDEATGRFLMGINDPVHLATDAQEQKLTIAHELMHMIVVSELADSASDAAKVATCDGVFEVDEGCYKRGSIYADFVARFWSQADRDAAAKNVDLFEQKKGSFVTPYAATSPHEDIADSFSVWVLSDGKGETVAHAKQRFFENYPYLVALRQQIRRSVIGDVLKERRRVAPRNTKPRN